MKVLVLGVTGMLGNALFRVLASDSSYEVHGAARSDGFTRRFGHLWGEKLISGVDFNDHDALLRLVLSVRPSAIINCVGLVKQLAVAKDPLYAVPINTLLPHRLAALCEAVNARMVHFSTDCVFSGAKGSYVESDIPDAQDLYGRTKLLGEVDYPHAITLRTSIIGHELSGHHSLIGWFLAQDKPVKGFTKAIFSGLPTIELSRVVRDFVLPRPDLHGIYHVSAAPIDKYSLLKLVADTYKKAIQINPDGELVIDRSLDSSRFRMATGYVSPIWPELVREMREFN